MRIAFLDEAGISNRHQEPYTVVAGVIVCGDHDWLPLETRLQQMVERALPGVENAFFHTKDIYSGEGLFHESKGWDATRRFALLDEIAALPTEFTLPIVYGFYERARAVELFEPGGLARNPTELAHMMAATRCTLQIERCMRMNETGEICSITMENTPHSRRVLRDSQRFFRNPPPGYVDDSNKGWMPLTRIRGTPQFEEKADASLLQMADFCAFVIKRQLMRARRIESLFGPLRPNITMGYQAEGPSHPLFDPWTPSPERQF